MNVQNMLNEQKTSQVLTEVFNACPTLVQHQIMQNIQVSKYDGDTIILRPGDRADGIYIIIEGGVKLYKMKNGKKQVLYYHAETELIGIPHIINNTPFPFFAKTMGTTVLAYLPKFILDKMINEHSHSFYSLVKKLNEKATSVEKRCTSLMTDSAEDTVTKAITDLKMRFGTNTDGYINVQIPANEFAGYVGMSKTNLYRILHSLKEKHILFHHLDHYKLEKSFAS